MLNNAQKTYIDVLRTTAMMCVLFGHIFAYYKVTILKDQEYFPYIQNIGVVIFFLLSGFLTANSLKTKFEEKNYDFKQYFFNRFYRIYPCLIVALVFVGIIDGISIYINKDSYQFIEAYNLKSFFGSLFMIQNSFINNVFKKIMPFASMRSLWTLSIEWWFYLLIGKVYYLLYNKEKINEFNTLIFFIFFVMPSNSLNSGGGG